MRSKAKKVLPKKTGKILKAEDKNIKKRKRSRKETYAVYIYKVLKIVHPETNISRKSMDVINDFMCDMFKQIAAEASKLVKYNKKLTLSIRDIETSVRLLLPGELANHAMSEGTKAISKFVNTSTNTSS